MLLRLKGGKKELKTDNNNKGIMFTLNFAEEGKQTVKNFNDKVN